jgi:hypothetical protein
VRVFLRAKSKTTAAGVRTYDFLFSKANTSATSDEVLSRILSAISKFIAVPILRGISPKIKLFVI